MKSSHGVKTSARKSRRRRRRKASNGNKMKSVDVENHIGVKKTSSVGKKRGRKASVGVKEKVEAKMSLDEVEKLIISRLGSWDHSHHPECFNHRRLDTMHHFDMVKDWSEVSEEEEKDWIENLKDCSEEEVDEEEEMELDKYWRFTTDF